MPSQEERCTSGLGNGNPVLKGLVTLLGRRRGGASQHSTLPNEVLLMNLPFCGFEGKKYQK